MPFVQGHRTAQINGILDFGKLIQNQILVLWSPWACSFLKRLIRRTSRKAEAAPDLPRLILGASTDGRLLGTPVPQDVLSRGTGLDLCGMGRRAGAAKGLIRLGRWGVGRSWKESPGSVSIFTQDPCPARGYGY